MDPRRRLALIGFAILLLAISFSHQSLARRASNLPDNSPPLAAADNYSSVHGCKFMTPLDNDSDPDGDPLAIAGFPQLPAHGQLTQGQGNNPNYCADSGFTGSDSFTYTVCDNHGACSAALVTVNVINQAPLAGDDSYTVHGQLNVFGTGLLANDSDPDHDSFSLSVEFVGNTITPHGTVSHAQFQDGGFFYQPDFGYVGTDIFTYRVCDTFGACSAPATVTLHVVNQSPLAQDDAYTVHGQINLFGTGLLANDSDPDGDSFRFSEEFSGNIPVAHGGARHDQFQDGGFFYRPDPGYVGPDSFTYRLCDIYGACSGPATVTLNVVNQSPIVPNRSYSLRDTVRVLSPALLLGVSDPDGDPYHITNDFYGFHPTAHGGVSSEPFMDGGFVYTASPGYFGTDSFTYTICDSFEVCTTATVTLNITPNDDAENRGETACRSSVGGPVNVTNGNMYLRQTDYSLPAAGPAINVTRTYNSSSAEAGIFGRGWTSTYDEAIKVSGSTYVRWVRSDGQVTNFTRATAAEPFAPQEGDVHAQLLPSAAGFTLIFNDHSIHQFNSAGQLLTQADANGNTTTLGYDANGFLSTLTDPFGRVLTVVVDSNGQIVSLGDTLGAIATYSYGADKLLLSVTYADNSASHFTYDGAGRLTSVTDALGNLIEAHSYDSQGRAITSEKQGGVEHYSLDYPGANVTDVTDALGHVTKYTFDTSKGRKLVTQVEGTCGCGGGNQVKTWTYDNQLNVSSMTDALGHVSTYTYDASGNRLTETDSTGTASYTYNQLAEVLTNTDQLNSVTTNTYDANGNLLTTTNALGKTTSFTYDPRGLLLAVVDARGKTTSFAYDASGNLITTTDALSHDSHFAYDARGRMTAVTNALGQSTLFGYDAVGRLTQLTQADGSIIGSDYDLAGRRTGFTDAKGNRSTHAYDGAYRLISQTDAANQTTSFGYDAMSNLTSTTDAALRVTNYDYDDFNRLVKITQPPATAAATRLFQALAYDADGNVTQRTDHAGRVTSYAFDSVNRVTSITDPDNKTTAFEYDALSRRTALVDAIGQRYRFKYDALGQLKRVRRGNSVMSFTYDPVGNRKHRLDYNGALTTYAYDALNRLKTITYPDTTTVNYTYDKLSRLQTAANENGTIDFDYNKLNRLTSATDVFGQVVEYNYDANGNRTRLSLNGSTAATYRYDSLDRLTKLLDSAGAAFNFTYDVTSRLTSRKAPNGLTATYQYDDLDRLTRIANRKGANTIADFQYQFNAANNIINWTNSSGSHAFGYDALDHLISATNSAQANENYSFDAVGNRTGSHLSATYTYQPFNRLASTATATFTYDHNGNLTAKTDSLGTTSFSWNVENQLTQVRRPNGLTINYKYDALGRRIQRTTNAGANERYVYDGQDVLLDLNANGSVANAYINGPGIDNHLGQTSSTGATSYFLTDHLGSIAGLTNSDGNLVDQIAYEAFGNSTGSARTRYGYTGRERDPDTGLLYNRARWYDPQIGRFISEDPIGFSGGDINLYGYGWNNPARYRDPLGLDGWGNDAADWLDRKIEAMRRYLEPDPHAIGLNTVVNYAANVYHSQADLLRTGSGIGRALFDPCGSYEDVFTDVRRASTIALTLAGPATGILKPVASVPTPYGLAIQSVTPEARAALSQVENGATLYKGGVLGKSETGASQFLSLENPLSRGYAARYGLPLENSNFEFILSGRVQPAAPVITRLAPGIGQNSGGAVEAVTTPGSFRINSFYMP